MKKFTIFALLFALMLSLFGCSNTETSSVSPETDDNKDIFYSSNHSQKNQQESQYDAAMSAFDCGYYSLSAKRFYELGDYKNAKEMVNESKYQEAMDLFEKENFMSSFKLFSDLGEYKDSKELSEKLKSILSISSSTNSQSDISFLNGTYYCDNYDLPGKGFGQYLFINDGEVAFELESGYTPGNPVYYVYMVAEDFSEGGFDFSIKSKVGSWEEGWVAVHYDDGDIFIACCSENPYSTRFNGLYSKISDSTPPMQ